MNEPRLRIARATDCAGDEVDQNLFHRRSPVGLTDPKLSPRLIRAHPRARTKSRPRRQAVGRGDLGVVMSGCPIAAVYLPSLRQARRRSAAGFQLAGKAGRDDGLSLRACEEAVN